MSKIAKIVSDAKPPATPDPDFLLLADGQLGHVFHDAFFAGQRSAVSELNRAAARLAGVDLAALDPESYERQQAACKRARELASRAAASVLSNTYRDGRAAVIRENLAAAMDQRAKRRRFIITAAVLVTVGCTVFAFMLAVAAELVKRWME